MSNDAGTAIMASRLKIENFKAMDAGALRGFCDVALPSGMILFRCGIFQKDGRAWAAPPSKQVIGRDGAVQRDANGKTRYEPVVAFTDRATQERWSGLVIDTLRAAHPEALPHEPA
jgi:hypothetical protein